MSKIPSRIGRGATADRRAVLTELDELGLLVFEGHSPAPGSVFTVWVGPNAAIGKGLRLQLDGDEVDAFALGVATAAEGRDLDLNKIYDLIGLRPELWVAGE